MPPESILVVDDDPGTCETLSDILELQGYAVHSALTGEAAEAIVRSQRIDAALLDLRLPDRSGLDVLRFMKDQAPETEVILVSGYATLTSAIEAMRYGAFGYVQKPVNVEEVLSGLKRALERQRMARELRQANAENLERLQELELLLETARVVSSRLELTEVLQTLAEQMVRQMQVTLCHISVLNGDQSQLCVRAIYPVRQVPWHVALGDRIPLVLSPTYKRVVEGMEVEPIRRGDSLRPLTSAEEALLLPADANSAFLVPMVVKEKVVGVVTLLEARDWARSPFTPRKVNLCRAMASGAAIAIENALLFEQRERTHLATLAALASALDARERETQAHSRRVQEYSLRLAKEMGVPEADRRHLATGALLHDVGKIGVRDAILLKCGELSEEEWAEMKKHPLIGYRMLKRLDHLQGERAIVLAHHERWDGSGYPQGLAGRSIPLPARIFAVADTIDAITSDRPYRKRRGFQEAREEIARCAGTQFDPEVVAAFLRVPIEEWEEIQWRATGS